MTKRFTRKQKSKKRSKNSRKTRKNKYGGEPDQTIIEGQERKYAFRQKLKDLIIQITNRKKVNEAITSIIRHFTNNPMINTLIPVSATGKPLDSKTYSSKTPIVDYVSPVIVIFDNLTDAISERDIIRLLDSYFKNSGNFNNLSSRFKISPIENEINKRRVNNVRILLNQSYPFHIIEDGLNEETKIKLAELIPTEQKITTELIPQQTDQPESEELPVPKLALPYPLPENNEVGYDRSIVPEFWNPLFENGENLINLRNTFMQMYEQDRYTEDAMKRFQICNLLEKLFPAYLTRYYLSHRETAKTLVNMNICSCIITLLYGFITYKLYEYKQDYLILIKGGRAIQLSLIDIPNVVKYFSEDADILIIPNKIINADYDFEKMENLSAHIAYLVKWFIPEEINIIVSLPSNPKNQNKEITKILYNDDKIYKALSDVGFGEMKEDIRRYFESPIYTPFYVDNFETTALFIVPTIDDMLSEKLYFYAKYVIIKDKIKNKIPISESGYENITEDVCDYYIFKFNRAIKQLVNSILKRNNINVDESLKIKFPENDENFKTYPRQVRENIYKNIDSKSKIIVRGILENFDDFSPEEKTNIIKELYPQFN